MPHVEISIPARIDSEIDRLVEQGAFVNRQEAIEGLLSTGLSAYAPVDDSAAELSDDLFTQAQSDQVDPAADDIDGPNDDIL